MIDVTRGPEKPTPLREGVRITIAYRLETERKECTAQFNFYADGRLSEVFCRPFKTGAYLEHLLDRFCVAVSRSLQHGDRIADMAKTMGDNLPLEPDVTGERLPDNIFSAIIRTGVELEAERMAPPPSEPLAVGIA